MELAVEKLKAAGPRHMHPHSTVVQGTAGRDFVSCARGPKPLSPDLPPRVAL